MAVRSTEERRADTLAALAGGVDVWVASADAEGQVHLIPLSYSWDGERVTLATLERSVTARNLRRAGLGRVALPSTEDVVIIEGPIEFVSLDADPALADAYAVQAKWDPRKEPEPYVFIRLRPTKMQAWRNVEELTGREIMQDGAWRG